MKPTKQLSNQWNNYSPPSFHPFTLYEELYLYPKYNLPVIQNNSKILGCWDVKTRYKANDWI